jgi:hypothetical protein
MRTPCEANIFGKKTAPVLEAKIFRTSRAIGTAQVKNWASSGFLGPAGTPRVYFGPGLRISPMIRAMTIARSIEAATKVLATMARHDSARPVDSI